MKILNVVIQHSGVVDEVQSFPIDDYDANYKTQVEKAEKLFEKWCRDNGFEEIDEYEEEYNIQDLIDNGYWESSNYDSVSLVWSNVNL